jgi:O-antigen/teichoic acid export membrane protein
VSNRGDDPSESRRPLLLGFFSPSLLSAMHRITMSVVGRDSWAENRTIFIQGAALVCVAAMNVVVARYWGARARGEVASVTVIATIGASLGGIGIHDALVWGRGHGASKAELGAWARFSLLTASGVALLTGGPAALLLGLPAGLAVATAALTIATQFVRVQIGWFLAWTQLRLFELARLGTYAAGLVVLALMVWLWRSGHPIVGLIGGQAFVAAAILLGRVGLPLIGRYGAPRGIALRVGVSSAIGGLVQTSLARTDVLIVAVLLSQSAAGLYAISLAAAEAVLVAANGLAFHALKVSSTGGSEDRILFKALVLTLPLLASVFLALHFLGRPVLGEQFDGVDWIFVLLAPGTLAMALIRIRWAAAIGRGKAALPAAAILAGLVVQTVLDLLTVRRFGVPAAAASASIAYVMVALLTILFPHAPTVQPSVTGSEPALLV